MVATMQAPMLDDVMRRLESGEARVLSRAVSLIENADPRAVSLLERVYATAPHPWVIGITGVGGAGKSTLLPRLAEHFASGGERVAILAVDPSSPITGGAVLGDRIRSVRAQSDHVYFRSLASRGAAGGVSSTISDVARLMSAGGRRIVLIETVGAGQSEVAIRDTAHVTVVVTAPGLGDEVQAMKAGILEIGDILVVNKADLPGAEAAANTLQYVMATAPGAGHLIEGINEARAGRPLCWYPPVLRTSAIEGDGVVSLVGRLNEHRAFLERSGQWEARNLARDRARLLDRLERLVLETVMARVRDGGLLEAAQARLKAAQTDPMQAARDIAAAVL
ncbi:MAG: methylmalonyl Co-A mutase-associated GTPase MeaB [Lautropia sp.]